MSKATQTVKRELPKTLPMQHRYFKVRAEDTAEGSDLVPISFSSENPVKRSAYGLYWWYEVLSHDEGSVITDRLEQGIAVLDNHDVNQRVGILENGTIADGTGRGDVRFNTTQKGQDVQREVVIDKTLPFISVGYIPHEEMRTEDIDPADDEDENYLGTYTCKQWEPIEVSFVSIPADPSVGVGRSAEQVQYPVRFLGGPAIPPVQAAPEVHKETRMTPVAEVTSNVNADKLKESKERGQVVASHVRNYPAIMTREVADKFLGEDTPIAEIHSFVLNAQREQQAKVHAGGPVQLSEGEVRKYDFMKVVRSLGGRGMGLTEEAGFEREVSQEIAKKSNRDTAGIFVPTGLPIFSRDMSNARERALVAGTGSAGGNVVATELISFLDVLRPKIRLGDLGAKFMGGMTSNFSLPKMLTDADFNWVGENPGEDNSDIDPTFGQVQFSPLTATASTSFSRQLLVQNSVDVEVRVRNGILQRAAIGIEKAALQGSGGTQPTGLLTTTGVHVVALGTNGGQPTKGTFVDMLTAIAAANADGVDPSYLITPEIAGYLAKNPELANTIALAILTYQNGQAYVNGHKAMTSNLLPKTLTKGTATGTCHAMIGGNWGELTIAEFGAMELIVDPYTKSKQSLVNIVANLMVDSNLTYPQAFSVCLDAIPQ